MWRRSPQIDRDVIHRPPDDAHKLTLRAWILEMQSAQDTLLRMAVIVLYKGEIEIRLSKNCSIPAFEKESAIVAKDLRLYYKWAGNVTDRKSTSLNSSH